MQERQKWHCYKKKLLVTFHEQQRILQFNNQNLHNANIIHII
jgi:hypothetical protein